MGFTMSENYCDGCGNKIESSFFNFLSPKSIEVKKLNICSNCYKDSNIKKLLEEVSEYNLPGVFWAGKGGEPKPFTIFDSWGLASLEKTFEIYEVGYEGSCCVVNDKKQIVTGLTLKEINGSLKQNKNNLQKAIETIIERAYNDHKEHQVKEKMERLKVSQFRNVVREEAEKRLFGQNSKKKRITLSEEDKEVIFERFDNKCVICKKEEGLHIHHKDKHPSNNRLDNLIVLCGVCHKKIHMRVR